jgi:hypothetical protein
MSAAGLILNLLLAVLLISALGMGWRLNQRLKALRDSHDGFARAVRDLNDAAARAEQGLADLRAASDEALDVLSEQISKGRQLSVKLQQQISQAPQMPAARAPEPRYAELRHEDEPEDHGAAERRLGALLAAAREARPERVVRADPPERAPRREPPPPVARPRFTVDDDIFDDGPLTLDAVRGARR